jgi:hypothetical protein
LACRPRLSMVYSCCRDSWPVRRPRKPDGKLRYVEVWEARELCDKAFNERVHPAVYGVFRELEFHPGSEPERHEFDVVDFVGPLGVQAITP